VKYWGIESESFDSRDNPPLRTMELTKRRDCKVPAPLLSQAAGVSAADASGATATLHFYELHKGILTKDINAVLHPFMGEYTLQWMDEENCLAIFKNPNTMQRALNAISRGLYKVRPYVDNNGGNAAGAVPVAVSHGIAVLGSTTRKPKDPAAPRSWSPAPGTFAFFKPSVSSWLILVVFRSHKSRTSLGSK